MKKIFTKMTTENLLKFFSILGVFVFLLIIISVANNGLSFNSPLLLILLVGVLSISYKNKKSILTFCKKHPYLTRSSMLILIIIGFALRFLFLLIQPNFTISETLSDTGVHWYGAQQLITDGALSQEVGDYENMFPYLSAYTETLAVSMALFGKEYQAILFLNIFFDLISCLGLFALFYLWKKRLNIALLAATIWAINPIQIIFCGMPLAIVIVNTFVILGILCIFLTLRSLSNWRNLSLFSLLSGLVLAIGNAYRPIFIVFLLAFLVCLPIKTRLKPALVSSLLIAAGYFTTSLMPSLVHAQINPYLSSEKNQAGWSFYVGSNYETNGKWSSDDRDIFFGPVLTEQAEGDTAKANKIILMKGIKRYLSIIKRGNFITHFLNKVAVIFGDAQNAAYDLLYIFHFPNDSAPYKILQDSISSFYFLVLTTLGYHVFRKIKKKDWLKKDSFISFLTILFSALFFASLLVEVMNRYIMPLLTILIIITLGLVFDKISHQARYITS